VITYLLVTVHVRDAVCLVARLVHSVHLSKSLVLHRSNTALSIYHHDLVHPFHYGCVLCPRVLTRRKNCHVTNKYSGRRTCDQLTRLIFTSVHLPSLCTTWGTFAQWYLLWPFGGLTWICITCSYIQKPGFGNNHSKLHRNSLLVFSKWKNIFPFWEFSLFLNRNYAFVLFNFQIMLIMLRAQSVLSNSQWSFNIIYFVCYDKKNQEASTDELLLKWWKYLPIALCHLFFWHYCSKHSR
jgi:hypothetical protein